MFKVTNEKLAQELSAEHKLHYGRSIFDGAWYLGTVEQLDKCGAVDPKPPYVRS